MGNAKPTEAYKFVGYDKKKKCALFQHKNFFGGKKFLVPINRCRGRLQKLIEQGMPNDQTLAALNTWPAEEEKKLTVH